MKPTEFNPVQVASDVETAVKLWMLESDRKGAYVSIPFLSHDVLKDKYPMTAVREAVQAFGYDVGRPPYFTDASFFVSINDFDN